MDSQRPAVIREQQLETPKYIQVAHPGWDIHRPAAVNGTVVQEHTVTNPSLGSKRMRVRYITKK